MIRHATNCASAGCTPSHPQFVKGEAGSPYAITDYYDVNPYLADNPDERMAEFDALVQRTHNHSLKVIMDFVPNHVSRDNVNFGADDDKTVHWKAENDFYYYPGQELRLPVDFVPRNGFEEAYREFPARATGNNCFNAAPSMNDWYETVKLNYCDFHTGTWDKMLDILCFWAERGVDGFRCDMVELVPPEFMKWLISEMKSRYPSLIFIAEVYGKDGYRSYLNNVGFDCLYDKSGLYDILQAIVYHNVHEDHMPMELWYSTRRITGNWQYLGDIQEGMLNFLENHDEQRLASEGFAAKPSNGFAALAVSLLFNNASFMLYSGQELGERGMDEEGYSGRDGRSSIFDWWKPRSQSVLWNFIHGLGELEGEDKIIFDKYLSLINLSHSKIFSSGMTYDLCFCNVSSPGFDLDRHFAFLRYDDMECCLAVCNFGPRDSHITVDIPVRDTSVTLDVPAFDCIIEKL